jgi:hypothetical protein
MRCLDRRHCRFIVRRMQDDVVAGLDRTHGRVARADFSGDGVHAHRVRVDKPAELHLAAQQTGHDRFAECGGTEVGRIQRRQLNVADHDGVGAGRDACTKRREIDRVEPLARMVDDWQAKVRVDVGIAVTGKMFDRREHAACVQSTHVGGRQAADEIGRLAERSRVNDRIERIAVDVGERRKIDVDADGARLLGRDARGLDRE